jgi:hypothetical protein
LRRKSWKSHVRTKMSTKGFVSLAVRDIFGDCNVAKRMMRGRKNERYVSRVVECLLNDDRRT